jgi:hypothetical protein
MRLEHAKTGFECIERRFCCIKSMAPTGRPFEHGALPSDEGLRLGNGVLRVERWSTAYFTSVVITSQFQIFSSGL